MSALSDESHNWPRQCLVKVLPLLISTDGQQDTTDVNTCIQEYSSMYDYFNNNYYK